MQNKVLDAITDKSSYIFVIWNQLQNIKISISLHQVLSILGIYSTCSKHITSHWTINDETIQS